MPSHAAAVAECRRAALPGISAQGYALRDKIFDVERALRPDRRVVEVHPELCFAVMYGAPPTTHKKSWAGFIARRELLAHHRLALLRRVAHLDRLIERDALRRPGSGRRVDHVVDRRALERDSVLYA